jgi:hypothetical protein
MTIWFNKKFNGKKRFCSKSISINYHIRHWKLFQCYTNGAIKGRKEDTCFDSTINFFGLFLSYTNWDYNCEYRYNDNTIRLNKLKRINKIRKWKI